MVVVQLARAVRRAVAAMATGMAELRRCSIGLDDVHDARLMSVAAHMPSPDHVLRVGPYGIMQSMTTNEPAPHPMDTWKRKVIEHHLEQCALGEHDELCEWRIEGHFLCSCRMRTRVATGFTEPPADLDFFSPPCTHCGRETYHDGDSLTCGHCNVGWESDGTNARFLDDHGPIDVEGWMAHRTELAAKRVTP